MGRKPRGRDDDGAEGAGGSAAEERPASADHHFHVRRAIVGALNDAQFASVVGDARAAVEDYLTAACTITDAVAQALPTSNPVDFDDLRRRIAEMVTSHAKTAGNEAAAARFADIFVQRSRSFLHKVHPVCLPVEKERRKAPRTEDAVGGPSASSAPEAPKTDARKDRDVKGRRDRDPNPPKALPKAPTRYGDDPSAHERARPARGGVLDAPDAHAAHSSSVPSNSGSIFGAAPSHMLAYPPRGGSVLLTPPLVPAFMSAQPSIMGAQPLPPPPQHANVFAKPPEVPPLGTRYVTLRHIPAHHATREGLKGALESLCYNIRAQFVNYECFSVTSEDGTTQEHSAVCSFSNEAGASELAAKVNQIAQAGSSPVVATGATAEEIVQLWGPRREELEALESSVSSKLGAMYSALSLQKRLADADAAVEAADAALREIKRGPAPPEKAVLVPALRACIAANDEKKAALEAASEQGVTAAASPPRYSSSSATPGNQRHLVFFSQVPVPLTDDMVLMLLQELDMAPVHIWRDGSSNNLCVELANLGSVCKAMRTVDFLDNQFCQMLISGEKPPTP